MLLSEINGKRVGIWGFGKEGAAVLRVLQASDPRTRFVVVTDEPIAHDDAALLSTQSIDQAIGAKGIEKLRECDVVIRSPGISRYRADMQQLINHGVRLTTGTNMWFAHHPHSTVVAITGTKGKSTSASLLAHVLQVQGKHVVLAGNIGTPLMDVFDTPEPDVWVLELSSYQTSDITASPSIGVVLNLYREHTDWHVTQTQYFDDKFRLFAFRNDCVAVLNHLNAASRERSSQCPHAMWFGRDDSFHVRDRAIFRGPQRVYEATDLALMGEHNLLNTCAVLTVVEQLGMDALSCAAALGSFVPLRHRLELVGERDGVRFIDDSIATTPEATMAAVRAMESAPVSLLLGGHDRRQDYTELIDFLQQQHTLRAVITMPDNGKEIASMLRNSRGQGTLPFTLYEAYDLGDAVGHALRITPRGGVILLSPAAPSYGHFRNFEERGDAFATAALDSQ